MKIRILGPGTTTGVPRIGNDWGACDPNEPRNRRTRVSALVEHEGTRILIDTGPDMREQLLAANVATIDAVLWTHDHADHCHGIDDLRQLFHNQRAPVRGFARADTLNSLKARFDYVFAGRQGYRATVTADVLPDRIAIGPIESAVPISRMGRSFQPDYGSTPMAPRSAMRPISARQHPRWSNCTKGSTFWWSTPCESRRIRHIRRSTRH